MHNSHSISHRHLRVVIQNRPDAFTAPGGDTVLMEELARALTGSGVDVQLATGPVDLRGADLVHLINITLPNVARAAAENAASHGVPLVITPLLEDWPRYMERSIAVVTLFHEYMRRGYDRRLFQTGLDMLRSLPDGPGLEVSDVANQAALLFACGDSEAKRLRAAWPDAAERVRVAKLGFRHHDLSRDTSRALVREQFGLEDYILCCGRLETRKNQLMLLRALEDSERTLVLAGGGHSPQPAYVELVKAYRRCGETRILGRVTSEQISALMAAADTHVLPSWFELPGLVTLEAASAGTAVVASDWGAIRDYLPEPMIHYCQPDDPDSIRRAVEAALTAGPQPGTKPAADQFTWQQFGEQVLAAYAELLNPAGSTSRRATDSFSHILPEVHMNSQSQETYRFEASVIIPVHNRAELTRECLEALANCADRTNYELIVVDNHSTDETPRLLEAVEGDVTVLRQSSNRGFAAACNIGARVASGEYLVFLNNDTRPQSGWLDALVNFARANKDVGAVGARLLYPDGTTQHAGIAVSERHIPYHIFQNYAADHPAVMESRDMQAVTAACMLIPARLFQNMNGFDEGYRNGFEDVDLCLRMREQGRRVHYCAGSTVVHHEESTPGRKDFDAQNLERFMERWGQTLRVDEQEWLSRHGLGITWEGGRGTYHQLAAQPAASVAEARELYEGGQIEQAAAMLQGIVESRLKLGKEDSFETWQTLGNCLARLNRVDEAERAYHEAIRLDEQSERPYLGLGALAMLQENWQAAMYSFMNALARNPETLKGEFGVGLSMAQRNMHQGALERFRRVLDQEPYNAEALFYYYRSAVESGEPRLAIQPLQTYLERYPNDANFLFSLCGAYWKAGDLATAVDLCQRVLALEPDHQAARDVMQHLRSSIPQHA